jgi:hypothetical protein
LEILLVELLPQHPFAGALEVEEKQRRRNDQKYDGNEHPEITTSP